MKFSGLKQKFRRAVLSCLAALGLMGAFNARAQDTRSLPGFPLPSPAPATLTSTGLQGGWLEKNFSPHQQKTLPGFMKSQDLFSSSGGKIPSLLLAPQQNPPGLSRDIDWSFGCKARPWPWRVKVYASHAFTHYFPSNLRIKTSRYDVTVRGYEWVERGSRDFFKPATWSKPGNSPLQIFDEPSNAYTLTFEKDKNVVFLSHFHPKFYQDPDQISHIKGKIDGIAVDHTAPVNQDLHGNYQLPGAMRLEDNKNTYLQMEFEAGYGRRFNVVNTKNFGKITYVPGISAGVQMGRTRSAVVDKEGQRREYNESLSLHGVGGSIRNKIEWTTQNERIGLFYENKTSLYHRKHDLLDGTQEFNFCYTANTAGFTFSLYSPDRKKHSHRPLRL